MMQFLFGLVFNKSCRESLQLYVKVRITHFGVVLKKLSPVNVPYPVKFWVHESTWKISKGFDILTDFVNSKSLYACMEEER